METPLKLTQNLNTKVSKEAREEKGKRTKNLNHDGPENADSKWTDFANVNLFTA